MHRRAWLVTLGFACVATILSYNFVLYRFELNGENPKAAFNQLVAGAAATPFQYRALVPWLVRGLARLPLFETAPLLGLLRLIEFVSVVGLAFAFRAYLSLFFRDARLTAVLALSLFYVLPFNFYRATNFYPYDMPSLLFFTLGLYFLYRQNLKWYYPLLVIASLNRETTYFLVLIYLITALGRQPLRTVARHAAVQSLLWLGIKTFLYWLYAGNPGFGLIEVQFWNNFGRLAEPAALLLFLSNWGFVWVPVAVAPGLIGDAFVRRSLWVIAPFFAIMSVAGVITELRIYGELIPVLLPAFWLIVRSLFTAGPRAAAEPAATP